MKGLVRIVIEGTSREFKIILNRWNNGQYEQQRLIKKGLTLLVPEDEIEKLKARLRNSPPTSMYRAIFPPKTRWEEPEIIPGELYVQESQKRARYFKDLLLSPK